MTLPINNLPLSQEDKNMVLNFIENNHAQPIFSIACKYDYLTPDQRQSLIYGHITDFLNARLMLAIIMLMDNGEEF